MSTSTTGMDECEPDTSRNYCDFKTHYSASRPDGFVLVSRAAAGDAEAGRWLGRQVLAWAADAARGEPVLPLHRRLRLPPTACRLRLHARDHWLCEAARHVGGSSEWRRAVNLHAELMRFRACAAWASTLDRAEPPRDKFRSDVRRALWWTLRYGGGRVPEERRLADILALGGVLESQHPRRCSLSTTVRALPADAVLLQGLGVR